VARFKPCVNEKSQYSHKAARLMDQVYEVLRYVIHLRRICLNQTPIFASFKSYQTIPM